MCVDDFELYWPTIIKVRPKRLHKVGPTKDFFFFTAISTKDIMGLFKWASL